MAKPRPGDIYRIALPDGLFAYAHVLLIHAEYGYLVRVFDRVGQETPVQDLTNSGELFPPVFVALTQATKAGAWRRVGTLPVSAFEFPTFRLSPLYENWCIWDGAAERRFIGRLPQEMRSLEIEMIWSYQFLAERIATGHHPLEGVF
jgi:Immunity protein 26